MTRAHIWTDGSCIQGHSPGLTAKQRVQHPPSHAGGWAAVVERGNEDWALRGREPKTTATRMELRAMIEGLASLPDGCEVTLHTDSTVAVVVQDPWRRGVPLVSLDADLWHALADQLERLYVEVDLVLKGPVDPRHKRVHVMAGAEARAQDVGLPFPATVEEAQRKKRRKSPVQGQHLRGCTPQACVLACPVGGWVPTVVG